MAEGHPAGSREPRRADQHHPRKAEAGRHSPFDRGPITRPFTAWRRLPPLRAAVAWAQRSGIRSWLIGGALRDLLLERPVHDWDLVVEGSAAAAAHSLAEVLGGTRVELNEVFRQYRVVLPRRCGFLPFDLQSLEGRSPQNFLAHRDFSVNALAWPLEAGAGVLDPTGGLADLVHRRLRALPGALAADPVRALRGLRLAAELDLKVSAAELRALQAAAPGLHTCSAERIREELFRLLACWPAQARWVRRALEWVLGPDAGRHARLRRLPPEGEEPYPLLVFAAALPAGQAEAGRRLRFSRREIHWLASWEHLSQEPAPRSVEEWLAALWPVRAEAPALNRLAAAAGSAALRRVARTARSAVRRLAHQKPWLDGLEAARASGLQGPELGALLARLAARQALGKLRSRAQARAWAARDGV